MSTAPHFLKTAKLSHILDYVHGEFRIYEKRQTEANDLLRKSFVENMRESHNWIKKHKKIFDWMAENPNIQLSVYGFHDDLFEEKLLKAEARIAYPELKLKYSISKDAAIAYLHFIMPNDRDTAIKAILNKYYADYPAFIESFEFPK